MHDLVIRNATIVDGTGAEPKKGSIAVEGSQIVAVDSQVGQGQREIDAKDNLVTPGWVDIHTHYDGPLAVSCGCAFAQLDRNPGRDTKQ